MSTQTDPLESTILTDATYLNKIIEKIIPKILEPVNSTLKTGLAELNNQVREIINTNFEALGLEVHRANSGDPRHSTPLTSPVALPTRQQGQTIIISSTDTTLITSPKATAYKSATEQGETIKQGPITSPCSTPTTPRVSTLKEKKGNEPHQREKTTDSLQFTSLECSPTRSCKKKITKKTKKNENTSTAASAASSISCNSSLNSTLTDNKQINFNNSCSANSTNSEDTELAKADISNSTNTDSVNSETTASKLSKKGALIKGEKRGNCVRRRGGNQENEGDCSICIGNAIDTGGPTRATCSRVCPTEMKKELEKLNKLISIR